LGGYTLIINYYTKAQRICILIVLLSFLFGCHNNDKNVQNATSEQDDINVFITCFETIDNAISTNNDSTTTVLKSDGWVQTNDGFEKEISGVHATLGIATNGDSIITTSIALIAENSQTDLQNFSKFEEFIIKLGPSYKLNSWKTCSFNDCESDIGNIIDFQSFYNSLNDIFALDTFTAIWESNDHLALIAVQKNGNGNFLFSIVSQ